MTEQPFRLPGGSSVSGVFDDALLAKSLLRFAPFRLPSSPPAAEEGEFGGITAAPTDPPTRVQSAWFGTPMFFTCTLGGVELPNAPLIMVEGQKLVVKTPVAGGDFAVIEIIGLDSYRITMQGYALVDPGETGGGLTVPSDYPADWARTFAQLHRRKEALAVECELLGYFGITHVVIEDFKWSTQEGSQGYAPYQLTCVSDVLPELLLREAQQEGATT
jgi:hypothetical protein